MPVHVLRAIHGPTAYILAIGAASYVCKLVAGEPVMVEVMP